METPQRTVQSASRQKASLKEEGLRAQYPWLLHLRGCRSQPPETFKFDTAKFEAKLEQILSEPSEVSETSSDEEVLKILQRMETGLSSALSNLKSAPHASSSLRDGLQSSLKQLECGITCTQAMMHKDEEAIAAAFEHPLMQACKPNSLNGSSIEEEDSQDKAGRDGAVRDTAEEQGDFDVTAFDSALLETDPETDEVVFESGCESSSCSDDEESSDEDSPKVPFIWWRENDLEDALKDLVGLEDLKQMLRQWCKGYALDKKRRFTGAKIGHRKPPNMVFIGNPGTGKTKVARMLAPILHYLGAIEEDKVIEVQRTDLVGGYVGHTGIKTRSQLRKAKGGILFVDEAYRLLKDDSAVDYGREALEEILSQMDRGDLMVIFAGYPDPMRQFLDCNEGFRRRVGRIIEFPDYTPRQIADIMMTKLAEKGSSFRGFQFAADCTPEAVAALIESGIPAEGRSKRNGGLAGTLLEYARERLDRRLNADHAENAELDELMTIQLKDLEAAVAQVASCASL